MFLCRGSSPKALCTTMYGSTPQQQQQHASIHSLYIVIAVGEEQKMGLTFGCWIFESYFILWFPFS